MKNLEERFRGLRDEYLQDYQMGRRKKQYPNRFEEKDIELLETLRDRTVWYPFMYSIPATMLFFGMTQVFSVSLLRNPLRKVDSFQMKSNKYTRLVYFISGSLIIMPLTHAYHWHRYQNARHMVYNRYRPLVDRYVLVRDNMTITNTFK